MASAREIKRRIGSVKNISQVTRALEAVSASRVRRAQEQALNSRAYAEKAWEVLVNVASATGANEHALLGSRDRIKSVDIVLVTSDRSLCGAYNNNIINVAERFANSLEGIENVRWITVGRKGRDYLARRGKNIVAEFSNLPTPLSIANIAPIGNIIVQDFLSGTADAVFIAYTDFVNVIVQRPAVVNLLPLQPFSTGNTVQQELLKAEPNATTAGRDYLYEPSAGAILDEIIPRFTTLEIYQALLESNASEHSARMVAMRNASEAAIALAADLTLEYNKARQLAITSEILDIVGGVNALQQTQDKAAVKAADKFIKDVGGELLAERRAERSMSARNN
jgi:F-type H+-transporting ATPase subunit gamma